MSDTLRPAERAALVRARELARTARGQVSPNPLVGAVILADDDTTIAEGWHAGPGLAHAEAMALAAADERAGGSTLICTLEPCSHHGRTPPCADAVIAAGVRRVVIGCRDPLERGRAGGIARLRAAGIEVVEADQEEGERCRELISDFLTHGLTGRPEVTVKLATSLDGKIATASGESRWITGPPARALVHRWRADSDAVAVGIGTALADDPALTARDLPEPVRQPTRVIFDNRARLPLTSALVAGAAAVPVVVIAGTEAPASAVEALRAAGVSVELLAEEGSDRVGAALDRLGALGIQSLFVEGGAELAGGLLRAGAIDRVAWFLAPLLIGGVGAPSALGGAGITALAAAPRLLRPGVESVGDDILVRGRLRPPAWVRAEG